MPSLVTTVLTLLVAGMENLFSLIIASVVALLALNGLSYLAAARADRKTRRAEAKNPHVVFKMETAKGDKEPWAFRVGPGKVEDGAGKLVGSGNGRVSWIPSGAGDVIPEASLSNAPGFKFDREKNPNTADLVYRGVMLARNPVAESDMTPKMAISLASNSDSENEDARSKARVAAAASAIRGSVFYSRLQSDQGFWPGDYGGPMFLLPGLVIACYVTGVDLGPARKAGMLRYVMAHQQAGDGGWGTHIEGRSTMFGSVLNYSIARLLGLPRTDLRAVRGRHYIKANGGAIAAPQWAKFWLAVLGAYDWQGINPTPPELWMLPNWFPFHPGKMWCHCRMVYLPMSALFGSRFVFPRAETDIVVQALREELYCSNYDDIAWGTFGVRECIAEQDKYNPQSWVMTLGNSVLHHTLENPLVRALFHYPLARLRVKALDFVYNYINAEDRHTNWVDIGPVSKAFHVVATYVRFGPESTEFQNHLARLDDYLWLAEDGLKMQGYNGSMCWDTCFATHAIITALEAAEQQKTTPALATLNATAHDKEIMSASLNKAVAFVDDMQVQEDVDEKELYFRDNSTGGWPFSSRDHGWPISDCTAEGIKATILFEQHRRDGQAIISQARIEQAVIIILDLQNTQTDNGWASYEVNRGYEWYELLNPAQVFGSIMIDYSYVECSSAAVQSLCEFVHHYPDSALVGRALKAALSGAEFILGKQRANGGWYGSWAVCFTYAVWFGIEGLASLLATMRAILSNEQVEHFQAGILLGCDFLIEKQRTDGGWGESVESCVVQEWVENESGSQVVQTAWAVLALIRAADSLKGVKELKAKQAMLRAAAAKGAIFLCARQTDAGDWDQECISGVFNKSCAITYTAYRNVFPIWALARFSLSDY